MLISTPEKADSTLFRMRLKMSHSVKITTPIPSPEEVAVSLGVSRGRLEDLLALVNDSKTATGERRRTPPAGHIRKRASKKAASKG